MGTGFTVPSHLAAESTPSSRVGAWTVLPVPIFLYRQRPAAAKQSDFATRRTEMRMRDVIMLSLGFVLGIITVWFVVASLVA